MSYGTLYILRDGRPLHKVELRRGTTTIGRDPKVGDEAKIVLEDEILSRLHAKIVSLEESCTITDTSTNGTQLNGERLIKDTAYPLKHGDTITLGPFTIRFVQPMRPAAVVPLTPGSIITDAKRRVRANGIIKEWDSDYWQFLPPFYRDTDASGVLNALLLVCETVLRPLDQMIRDLDVYVDPHVAPEAMLPWLALWVDLPFDQNWSAARSRQLILRAAELNAWRGTRRGVREYVKLYTQTEPIIVEPGQERSLGTGHGLLMEDLKRVLNIKNLGELKADLRSQIERELKPGWFRVIALVAQSTAEERANLERTLDRIIEAEKPAHTRYELVLYTLST